jgi:hypothetical protein
MGEAYRVGGASDGEADRERREPPDGAHEHDDADPEQDPAQARSRQLVLMPAKNNTAANSTTPST